MGLSRERLQQQRNAVKMFCLLLTHTLHLAQTMDINARAATKPAPRVIRSPFSSSFSFVGLVLLFMLLLCCFLFYFRTSHHYPTPHPASRLIMGCLQARAGAGRSAAAKKKSTKKSESGGWDWESRREMVLSALVDVANCEHLPRLWPMNTPEQGQYTYTAPHFFFFFSFLFSLCFPSPNTPLHRF